MNKHAPCRVQKPLLYKKEHAGAKQTHGFRLRNPGALTYFIKNHKRPQPIVHTGVVALSPFKNCQKPDFIRKTALRQVLWEKSFLTLTRFYIRITLCMRLLRKVEKYVPLHMFPQFYGALIGVKWIFLKTGKK